MAPWQVKKESGIGWVGGWVGSGLGSARGAVRGRPATTARLYCEEWSHVPLSGRCLDAVWTLSGRCLDAVWTLSGQAQDCLDICGSSTNQVFTSRRSLFSWILPGTSGCADFSLHDARATVSQCMIIVDRVSFIVPGFTALPRGAHKRGPLFVVRGIS